MIRPTRYIVFRAARRYLFTYAIYGMEDGKVIDSGYAPGEYRAAGAAHREAKATLKRLQEEWNEANAASA